MDMRKGGAVDQRGIDQAATAAIAPSGGGSPGGHQIDLSAGGNRRLSEQIIGAFLFACGALSILTTVGIIFVLFEQAFEFFLRVSIWDFLTGTEWTAAFDREYGVLPIVVGTLVVTTIAMVVAIPLGLMSAIYLSEYAPERVRAVLKPVLEVLAGIPTIVFGYFALTFITPEVIRFFFPDAQIYNALSAGVAVGILVLPMVASLSEDAMRSVPLALREGAFALGATKFEVAWQVITPAALSGIAAACILAMSRAIGETMIVAIASGSRARLTLDPLQGMQTMTAYIVQLIGGEAPRGTTRYLSLFAVGSLLFLMTLVLNILSQFLVSRFREVYD